MRLSKVHYQFVQEGNTLGTTSGIEVLDLTLESAVGDLSEDKNTFFVLCTEGWSIDEPEELNVLLHETLRVNTQVAQDCRQRSGEEEVPF